MAKNGTKPKLTEVGAGKEHQKASEGKFRSMVIIDSAIYQIEEDKNSFNEALEITLFFKGKEDCLLQIFDDKGVAKI